MRLFSEIKTKVHDASGIVNPEHYYWDNDNSSGIYYPVKRITPEEPTDLLEDYENLPKEVQVILDKYCSNDGMSYIECEELSKELNAIGYDIDYYLDAEPFNLRKKE